MATVGAAASAAGRHESHAGRPPVGGLEDGVAEGRTLGVGGGDPIALPGRGGGQTDGGQRQREGLAEENGVAEGGDLPGGGEDPVALPRRGRLEVDGRRRSLPAGAPRKGASPKANTPPSAPTIQ